MFMIYLGTFMGFSLGGFVPNFILFFKTPSIFVLCFMNMMETWRWQLPEGKWKCFGLRQPLLHSTSTQVFFQENHGGPFHGPFSLNLSWHPQIELVLWFMTLCVGIRCCASKNFYHLLLVDPYTSYLISGPYTYCT